MYKLCLFLIHIISLVFASLNSQVLDKLVPARDGLSNQNLSPKGPASILSSLYGYDGCIGGVNNFPSEEEYINELKRRNCTVVDGPNGEISNVAPSTGLRLPCRGTVVEWQDGMPMVFNYPIVEQPSPSAIEIELSDGTIDHPICVLTGPAIEDNELDTLLLIGEFGDGVQGNINPVRINIVGDVRLQGPDGELSAQGLSYSSSKDMEYLTSSVRMVYARLWDVLDWDEGTSAPGLNPAYPNNCQYIYPETSHIVKVAFSGGVTLDGIHSVEPYMQGIFSLRGSESGQDIYYLGLADLGSTISGVPDELYQQDGDNYIDICLNIPREILMLEDLVITLNCDDEQESVLYPPKGKPYGCKPDEIVLTKEQAFGYFIMAWQTETI